MSAGTGLFAPKPPANGNDIRHFINAVLPSPTDGIGHVNLHYSKHASEGKLITGAGWPYTAIEDLLDWAAWCNDRPYFKGVWFCTSSQRSAGANAKGKAKAEKQAKLHVWLCTRENPVGAA